MRRICCFVLVASSLAHSQDPRLFAPSLTRLRANDPKAAEDVKPGSPVERTALAPDLEKAPWARKIQASEWLLRAYIFKQRGQAGTGLSAPDPYLARAWQLLQGAETQASVELVGRESIRSRNSSISSADPRGVTRNDSSLGVAERENYWMVLEWIRLEVAWRMKDPERMREALVPFPGRKNLDARERLHAFMASAHIGDWTSFVRWGEELEAAGQMDRLRALAGTDWALPDYPGLLKQVRQKPAASFQGSLPRAEWRVKSMALRLKGFRTEDAALSEKLKAGGGWTESGPVETSLLRVGAVTHWLKPGTTPMPLVGPTSADALELEGSLDLPLQGATAWRKEKYQLKPSAEVPGRWTGTLEVTQQALEGNVPAAQVYSLTFEVRLDLEDRKAAAKP